jgi:hypothetical protein
MISNAHTVAKTGLWIKKSTNKGCLPFRLQWARYEHRPVHASGPLPEALGQGVF